MATLTIMGSGASNGNMVETYMPYATYTSAAIANVTNGSDVGICSNAKTIIWDKSTVSTNDSGWYIFAVNGDLWIDLSANPVVVTTKDPNAPPGDHNTLIDGTAYAIDGGNALVDGTVYEIENGTALVNGTAYEIAFAVPVTVKITKVSGYSANSRYAYVEINGTQYTGSTETTIEVSMGTEMFCYATRGVNTSGYMGQIYVDNKPVAAGSPAKYTYTINTPITVKISGSGNRRIDITTS